MTSAPKIFVMIASYRDTECQWTVKSLFEQAAYPDRISVGIHWQCRRDEDADCFLIETRPNQCRILEVDARESLGVCWSRHYVQSLWQGEAFVLQIDSHMRFTQDWDEILLKALAQCPSERAVLSTYPPSYIPPDKLADPLITIMFARDFCADGILRLHSRGVNIKEAPPLPEPNPFCAAGFLFGPSQIITEIPYDPYLYFQGEEISLTVRLWTNGWDIFTPNVVVIYHDYSKRKGRPRHWEDHDHDRWTTLNRRSFARVRHLLGMEVSDDAEALRDIDRFGLGTRRTLADYEAFSGVDFRRRLINGKSAVDIESELPTEERRLRNREIFGSIYNNNSWGVAETRSGSGSTVSSTVALRADLLAVLDLLDVRILADVGCGDLNWMSHISDKVPFYLGFDVVAEIVEDVRRRFGSRRGHFFATADITIDDLPPADAILCRDVLTHMPARWVMLALKKIKASESRILIATTHQRGINDPIRVGGWQPIDLSAPPFGLPPPMMTLSESVPKSSKALGVWRLKDLPDFD